MVNGKRESERERASEREREMNHSNASLHIVHVAQAVVCVHVLRLMAGATQRYMCSHLSAVHASTAHGRTYSAP